MDIKKLLRGPLPIIIALAILATFGFSLLRGANGYKTVDTSVVVSDINHGKVKSAEIRGGVDQTVRITTNKGQKLQAGWVQGQGLSLQKSLQKLADSNKLESYNVTNPQPSWISSVLGTMLPILIMLVVFFIIMNQVQGGGGRVMSFGKSKAKLITKDTPKTTFADVAGCDEAVEELGEIKEFLQEPAKFQAVGAKIPKGVLLYGKPGTGKTLLARAVAGEAGVPFYSISGSDFVEMFVGVGASRVRDLFTQAKENAPAVVFIDEIDAVGRHRGAGLGGGHDEREQTLNQLLVEMDGFDVRGGVILIAATNRPDILDPALLRPGRFDRQIGVDPPDLAGRVQILKVHARGKPLAPDVDLTAVARRTPGFTGADLANVLNEAALLTARSNAKVISNTLMDEAIDRVIAGPQKRTRLMTDSEKLITAYHEGGHALVAAALPKTDPVHKITIMPRGRALGYTMVLPDEDKYSTTRNEMLDQLAYALGGRAAEEMVFHDPTTGAANDIEKATALARAMVTQYGMTERIGAIKLGEDSGEPFLGRDIGHSRNYSEEVAGIIDEEVRALISNAHEEAFQILTENRAVLDHLVRELLLKETLNKEQVAEVFAPVHRRELRPAWTGSPSRKPSDIPPVTPPPSITSKPEDNGSGQTLHPEPGPAVPPTRTGGLPSPKMPPGGGPTRPTDGSANGAHDPSAAHDAHAPEAPQEQPQNQAPPQNQ